MPVNRVHQQAIYESFDGNFVTALLGPRRVGKTSMVESYIKTHPDYKWVILNCDDFELRHKLAQQNVLEQIIIEAAEQHIGQQEKIWVAIDEVQKCPECFDQIKILYDKYKDQQAVKFILTGSALLELHRLSAETLAGRIEMYHLTEFSLQETLCLLDKKPLPSFSILQNIFEQRPENIEKNIFLLLPMKNKLNSILKNQLIWGGLPEVLQENDHETKIRYLANYLQTYLEKDIRPISTISSIELYRHMLDILAEQTGSVRDDTKLLEALGCSRDTFKKYRGMLAATLLYDDIYPHITKTIKRIAKSPKGYLTNNGLISYLTGIDDFPLLEKANLLGHRLENWALKELHIALANRAHRSHIYYWRMASGREVDFVIDYKPYVFPIEITYSEKIQSSKIKNLQIFMKNEPKAPYGVYIYMGNFYFDQTKNIYFIPAWAVC